MEEDSKLKVFISHSNKDEDYYLVNDDIIPNLEKNNITVYGQEKLIAGTEVVSSITKVVHEVDKILLFMSKNSLESSWCSFELLISLEKSQRSNQMSVVLLLHEDISESELPHIAVLQEARKIHFTKGNDKWVTEAVEALKEIRTVDAIMPAGNLAHGLVWSHYNGFLQYVLPVLQTKVAESDWYKGLSDDLKKRVSFKMFELVPRTCECIHDIPAHDDRIKKEDTIEIHAIMRGGNERVYYVNIYSVTVDNETYYCTCEFPNVIGTMKVIEEKHLAKFTHSYPEGKDMEGNVTAAFTTEDKKLQLERFYYTMNSVLCNFEKCIDTAKVILFNDERQRISDVLVEAIKEDLKLSDSLNTQMNGSHPPKLAKLESESELEYEYQVYVAYNPRFDEDIDKGEKIIQHLKGKDMEGILEDEAFLAGGSWANKLITASQKCRWFIFLLTANALKDTDLTFKVISALTDSITRKKVRVIPVVDRHRELQIPESLRWVTYIPYDERPNQDHLKSIYNIVSGEDIPMQTHLLLPAGDVAYGLAWGYVTNYLMKILPDVLDKIEPAFKKEKINQFRCPKKLYIVIPKSCDAGLHLRDRKQEKGRLSNFAKTDAIFPFAPNRPFSCNIYKVDGTTDTAGLFFVGQYAAPVTSLEEMKDYQIAGVNPDTMASEAKRFYEIVSNLMLNAVPKENGDHCEFIFFDDINESLADIMEKKIREVDVQTI